MCTLCMAACGLSPLYLYVLYQLFLEIIECPKEEMMAVFQLLHGEDAYRRIDVKETGENQV